MHTILLSIAAATRDEMAVLTFYSVYANVCAAMAGLLGLVGPPHWFADLFSHFQYLYAGLGALATSILLLGRRLRAALFCAACCVLPGWQIAAAWHQAQAIDNRPGVPLKLLTFNLNSGNRRHAEMIEFIRQTDPDVISLQEVTPDWAKALGPLRPAWPHGLVIPREGNFGIALLSKWPVEGVRMIAFGNDAFPSITAAIERDGRRVTLVATHPPPPIGERLAAERDHQLLGLGEWLAATPGDIALAGDLNATPWSHGFCLLTRASGLRPARPHGLQPATWPNWGGPAVIPIDHVLIRGDLVVAGLERGPALGSDHFPLIVALRLAGQPSP